MRLPEELETDKSRYHNSTVILLIRDPRDVLTSMYFQRKYRGHLTAVTKETSIGDEMTIGQFLEFRQGGLETIIEYYNIWQTNMNDTQRFMLMRYEDLHDNAMEQVQRLLRFLNIHGIPDELLRKKIESCSFENMQSMERSDAINSFRLKPGDVDNVASFKTRKGEVGGFCEYFDDAQVGFMNQMIADRLHPMFGY